MGGRVHLKLEGQPLQGRGRGGSGVQEEKIKKKLLLVIGQFK